MEEIEFYLAFYRVGDTTGRVDFRLVGHTNNLSTGDIPLAQYNAVMAVISQKNAMYNPDTLTFGVKNQIA